MTPAFKHGLLWTTPDVVARDIVRVMDRGAGVLYTPWFWRVIVVVIRAVPERVFRGLSL